MFEKLRKTIDYFTPSDMPAPLAALGMTQHEYERVREKVIAARQVQPRIALIGETGVGKSTTINALFNRSEPISHARACTTHEKEFSVKRGKFRVFDMPGLGEDIERDREHMLVYQTVLPTCDVVVWILKADNRAFSGVQRSLADLVEAGILDPRKLVLGMNQVDALQPGGWNTKYNIPSKKQEETLNERLTDVKARLAKVRGIPDLQIVPYSALKNFRVTELLGAMTDAAERRVQWVMGELANVRTFDTNAAHIDEEVER